MLDERNRPREPSQPRSGTTNSFCEPKNVFSRTAIRLLKRDGLTLHGHQFCTMTIKAHYRLSMLMANTLTRRHNSGLPVHLTYDARNCSFILIWDSALREYERLSNRDAKFSRDLSWSMALIIRRFASEQDLSFGSDLEKYAARLAFFRSLNVVAFPSSRL